MNANQGVQQFGGTSNIGVQAVGKGAKAEAEHVELAAAAAPAGTTDQAGSAGDAGNRIDGTVGNAVQAGTVNGPITITVTTP
ncbi:hypothetical protein AB0425_40730 [Actinosynnema sp. NPDC051121]